MIPKLQLDDGREIPLTHYELIIGRDSICDLSFDDKRISSHHCKIFYKDEAFFVEDLASLNGTFVNSKKIDQKKLANNDVIRVGAVKLKFKEDEARKYSLDAHHLFYKVQTKSILKDISFSVKSGEFVALIGPSGSGKSTLLTLLSGACRPTLGEVRCNGVPISRIPSYVNFLGFVPQQNIVHGNLSVKDNLMYSGQLRGLDENTTTARKDWLLEQLELSSKTPCLVKNLSGGEQKRVNMGVELLHHPQFLFLDEPTAGLDPALEDKTMHFLRNLAENGMGIVVATHITDNLSLCDKVIFIVDGQIIFWGKPSQLLTFFDAKDFRKVFNLVRGKNLLNYTYNSWLNLENLEKEENYNTNELLEGLDGGYIEKSSELKLLIRRYWQLQKNSPKDLVLLISQTLITTLLLLLLYDGEKTFLPYILGGNRQAKTLLFLMVLIVTWFGIFNGIKAISSERFVFWRERVAGLKIKNYILSKFAILTPITLSQTLFIFGAVWLMMSPPGNCCLAFITLAFCSLAGLAMGLLASSLAKNTEQAVVFLPILILPQILLSKAVASLDELGVLGDLLSGMTITRWGMESLSNITRLRRFVLGASDYNGSVFFSLLILLFFGVIFILTNFFVLRSKDGKRIV